MPSDLNSKLNTVLILMVVMFVLMILLFQEQVVLHYLLPVRVLKVLYLAVQIRLLVTMIQKLL